MAKRIGEGPGNIPSKLPAFLKEVSQILFALTIRATKTAMLTLEGSLYKKQEHKAPTIKNLQGRMSVHAPKTIHHGVFQLPELRTFGFAKRIGTHLSLIPFATVSDEKASSKHHRK